MDSLHVLASEGCAEEIEDLLKSNEHVDVNIRTKSGDTPLHYAVKKNNI
ncbi:ankyrin repeat domain-containing protein [Wolbachia endosymbiont of Bemisia tabaci]